MKEEIATNKVSVVGIPFNYHELASALLAMKELRRGMEIKYGDYVWWARHEPETALLHKKVWEKCQETYDPLIERMEKSLPLLST